MTRHPRRIEGVGYLAAALSALALSTLGTNAVDHFAGLVFVWSAAAQGLDPNGALTRRASSVVWTICAFVECIVLAAGDSLHSIAALVLFAAIAGHWTGLLRTRSLRVAAALSVGTGLTVASHPIAGWTFAGWALMTAGADTETKQRVGAPTLLLYVLAFLMSGSWTLHKIGLPRVARAADHLLSQIGGDPPRRACRSSDH